jgi:hypothetical protein
VNISIIVCLFVCFHCTIRNIIKLSYINLNSINKSNIIYLLHSRITLNYYELCKCVLYFIEQAQWYDENDIENINKYTTNITINIYKIYK